MVCGDESIGLKPQSLHYCQGYIFFCGTGERNQWYVLMMMVNKPESAVATGLTLFLFSLCHMELVHVSKLIGYLLTIFHVYTIGAMFTIM